MKAYYTELPLVSHSLGLGCTIDFIGEVVSGGVAKDMIVDWKTGSAIHDTHHVQLSVYMAILYDYTGVLIEDLAVVNIPQDGGNPKVEVVEDPWWHLKAALLTYERWKMTNMEQLLWVRAPQQMLDQRAKLKGKKRRDFEQAEWKPWFEWPWLSHNSLDWLKETRNKLKGENNELGTIEGSAESVCR